MSMRTKKSHPTIRFMGLLAIILSFMGQTECSHGRLIYTTKTIVLILTTNSIDGNIKLLL